MRHDAALAEIRENAMTLEKFKTKIAAQSDLYAEK